MIEAIDVAISDAYTIGIENYNRSKELDANASQLCSAANTLEQVNQHLSTHLHSGIALSLYSIVVS